MKDLNITRESITPTGKYLLLDIYEGITETAAGIIISKPTDTGAPCLGTIIKAGPESVYQKDQVVLFRRYSTDELKFTTSDGEQKVWMIDDESVLCLVNTV